MALIDALIDAMSPDWNGISEDIGTTSLNTEHMHRVGMKARPSKAERMVFVSQQIAKRSSRKVSPLWLSTCSRQYLVKSVLRRKIRVVRESKVNKGRGGCE